MKILQDIWRYAELAYHEPTLIPWNPTAQCFYEKARCDYCIISVEKTRNVISFRGTDSADGNLKAWVQNLRAVEHFHDSISPGIHDGFWDMTQCFLPLIKTVVDFKKPTILTGHSRGAAGVSLTAYRLIKDFGVGHPLSVIGFASPMWCNAAIRNEFNLMPIDCTLCQTSYDIVPDLPPRILGFRPVGKTYELKTHPLLPIPAFPFRVARGIIDHLPRSYNKVLSKSA